MMKKISLILLAALSISSVSFSQNADDALRYSQFFYSGTARFMSMGGAFTALGGDISSLSQNPAGLGVLRSSELTVTPQLFHFKSVAAFNGTGTEDYLYNFNLAQAGIVVNFLKNNPESGLVTLNFGYSFNKTNNFNQSISIEGVSNKSSLLDLFAEKSSGYFSNQLADSVPDAYLAWGAWLIDTLSGSNDTYGTVYSNYGDDLPSVYGQKMSRYITTNGYTGEHAFSIGGNYSNKLYFGATLAVSTLFYESKFEHLESTDELLPSEFTDFNYVFYYRNTGTGYSLKLGAIYKPIGILRIGFAFHSPTLYRIREEVNDNITSYFSYSATPYKKNNENASYSYNLTTPFRVLTGVALQIKKFALLSADYEFVDYRAARFSTVAGDDYNYGFKNREIKNSLKIANNIRLGAEVRLKSIYLRGGYGYYGKAWKAGDLNEDLNYNSLSLGIGFREQNVFADIGFTRLTHSQKYILYNTNLETEMANMDINRNIFTVTFGYKFSY